MLLSNSASVIVTVSAEESGETSTWVEIVLPFADVVNIVVLKLLTRWAAQTDVHRPDLAARA